MFLHKIAAAYFRARIKRLDVMKQQPTSSQHQLFRELISRVSQTEYGRTYGINSRSDYHTFHHNIPPVIYEEIEPYIERCRRGEKNVLWTGRTHWFAKSSGTTNAKSKFIPVTPCSIHDGHIRAGKEVLAFYFQNHSKSRLFSGKCLKLGGSHDVYREGTSRYGDISAVIIEHLPSWAEWGSLPPKKVALMSEWEAKMNYLVQCTQDANITSLAGVPSWMYKLLERVLMKVGKSSLLDIWPNLELYIHGGVSFDPYRQLYTEIIPKRDFKYVEVYNASEGFFACQDTTDADLGMLLLLSHGTFYEFIPTKDYDAGDFSKIIPLEEVQTGVHYALIISTTGGLWRYIIGDTVRFVSTDPYRIKIVGRTKQFINVFGEEVMIENTEKALEVSCKQTNAQIADYTVAPKHISRNKAGYHEWMIEFAKEPVDFQYFCNTLDTALKEINSDYEAKRYKDMTLSMPRIHIARGGLFYDWLKTRRRVGGQSKIPRLSNERQFLEELIEMNS